MKAIILLLSLTIMSMSFTSCSSEQVNEVKVNVAKKIKETVNKELKETFQRNQITVEGVDCSEEALKHSDYIYGKVADFLKVKSAAKSLAITSSNGIIESACLYVVDKGLLFLIEQSGDSAMCLKQLGKTKAITMVGEVCRKIKL